ncbi:transposon Tf2-6 polyprotein [Trichonephila clavipes]|nr:transposon Tf2-6 polyprotein [Trichonephila clavipes]
MCKKDLVTRIARWAMLLEEFDYEIIHRPGQRMKHVDALSRYPVMVMSDTLTFRLKNAQSEDEGIVTLKALLDSGNSQNFFERNQILYKFVNGRELIVAPSGIQTELIKIIHEKGHFSVAKTEEVVKQEFFIPNLNKLAQKVIVSSVPCDLANRKSGKREGFLNPIPKDETPLHTYHVDFIGPLESTNKNYQHILTQKTFGNPKRIITDRGSAFTSKAFNNYCVEEEIQHLQIATGVPRGNGQVERIHRTLIPVLTKLSLDDPTKWYRHFDRLQRILNSTVSRSIKWTPFELLTGVQM